MATLGSDGEPLLRGVAVIRELGPDEFYAPGGLYDPDEDRRDALDQHRDELLAAHPRWPELEARITDYLKAHPGSAYRYSEIRDRFADEMGIEGDESDHIVEQRADRRSTAQARHRSGDPVAGWG